MRSYRVSHQATNGPERVTGMYHVACERTENARASAPPTATTAMLVTASHWYVPIIPGDDGMADPSEMTPITKMIDAALSPENLTCDGELPRSEVNRRYKELMTAARQLKKYDPLVKFYEYETEI
jgi:hypothetical protein